ncbi:MAG: DUF2203 domain-containing protein [Candidatus Eisenbacteria bacterium]|nr:DUF2203 domain-containing protein [Candidatus Eisenbacteria bacterium]
MRITLFTVEEANQALVRLRPELERLRGRKRDFDRLGTRLDVLQVATSGAAPGNADAVELREVSERRRRLGDSLSRAVASLHETGVLVKDLDQGLCDFYALAGDRLVFLCWRLGETEVGHWHSLEEGFSGRRPLKNAGLE